MICANCKISTIDDNCQFSYLYEKKRKISKCAKYEPIPNDYITERKGKFNEKIYGSYRHGELLKNENLLTSNLKMFLQSGSIYVLI